jgi:hypothetical protein
MHIFFYMKAQFISHPVDGNIINKYDMKVDA